MATSKKRLKGAAKGAPKMSQAELLAQVAAIRLKRRKRERDA